MADPVAYRVAAFDEDGKRLYETVVPAGVQSLTRRVMLQDGAARVETQPAGSDELPEGYDLSRLD